MAFNQDKFVVLAGQGKRGEAFQTCGYLTQDSKAEVLSAGYFNDLRGKLSANDVISVYDNTEGSRNSYTVVVESVDISGIVEVIESSGVVTSVNGRAGDVVLDSSDVGLENVDNTSDADKPVSTATQTALDNLQTTLQGNIDTNSTAISNNASTISTNATNISTNATNIGNNSTAIQTLEDSVYVENRSGETGIDFNTLTTVGSTLVGQNSVNSPPGGALENFGVVTVTYKNPVNNELFQEFRGANSNSVWYRNRDFAGNWSRWSNMGYEAIATAVVNSTGGLDYSDGVQSVTKSATGIYDVVLDSELQGIEFDVFATSISAGYTFCYNINHATATFTAGTANTGGSIVDRTWQFKVFARKGKL